jgi:alpha-mannosidase
VDPIVSVSNEAVVIEAVKLAEDRSGDVIVRLYESLGGRADATVNANFAATAIVVTDLLEEPLEEQTWARPAAGQVAVTLRPFQLVTLRFVRS